MDKKEARAERGSKFAWRLTQSKLGALQLENRIGLLDDSAKHLKEMVRKKRDDEAHPQIMYALTGHRRTPEEEERAKKSRKMKAERVATRVRAS
jgi:hypothetical protein